ncbi:hypothetical protein TDB9533_01205 [Thalassocella blandensis]|nr:hypothetical protein TDB9533_01205 [Thalassocella blandensis]
MKVNTLTNFLIYQAMLLPFLWLVPICLGFMIPGYDSISQHLSEIAVMESVPTVIAGITSFCFLLASVSIALFPVGLMFYGKKRFTFTVVLGLVYGVGMLSNSIFPTGTPLHGLYGLPIYSVIIPAIFALEYGNDLNSEKFISVSIVATILNLVYLWANAVGLDPSGYRGVTQILGISVINIWYFLASYMIYAKASKLSRHDQKSEQFSEA